MLLPNIDPDLSDSAAMAFEFVRGAMATKAQSRRLGSYKEFARLMRRSIVAAQASDPALATQLYDH